MQSRFMHRMAKALTACAAISMMLATSAQLALASGADAPQAVAGHQDDHAARRDRSFVYVLTNPEGPNAVDAFARDQRTGQLSYRGRFATGGLGGTIVTLAASQHALVHDQEFLYAVNAGSDDISVFKIHRDGSLRLVSRTPSGGPSPVSLALHDRLLYVVNQGDQYFPGMPAGPRIANYTGFRVARDGKLQRIAGSTVRLNQGDTPTDITFNAAGDVLVGARLVGRILDSFRVNRDGTLTRADTQQTTGPFALGFHPIRRNRLYVADFFLPGASAFEVSRHGALDVINDVVDPPGLDNCWTAFSRDGRFLWTSSFVPGVLSLFAVERDGSLSFVSTHQQNGTSNVSDIATESSGRFLYALRPFPTEQTHIQVKRITDTPSVNGGLRDIQTVTLPPQIGANGQDTRGPVGLLIVDNPR